MHQSTYASIKPLHCPPGHQRVAVAVFVGLRDLLAHHKRNGPLSLVGGLSISRRKFNVSRSITQNITYQQSGAITQLAVVRRVCRHRPMSTDLATQAVFLWRPRGIAAPSRELAGHAAKSSSCPRGSLCSSGRPALHQTPTGVRMRREKRRMRTKPATRVRSLVEHDSVDSTMQPLSRIKPLSRMYINKTKSLFVYPPLMWPQHAYNSNSSWRGAVAATVSHTGGVTQCRYQSWLILLPI